LFQAVTVSIVNPDPFRAGADAAQELLDELGRAPDVVVLFASAALDPRAVIDGFYDVMPAAVRLVGCSSFAEINGEEALTHSVTAMGLRLGPLEMRVVRGEPGPGREVGAAMAAELASFEPSLLVVLPDVFSLRIGQLLQGLQDGLGQGFPIVGGAPADMGEAVQTHQFLDRAVFTGGVVGLALKGPLRVVTAAHSGYSLFGDERTVTKSAGARVVEIDGQNAVGMYLEYLGPRAGELPGAMIEHPLGIVVRGERHREEAALLIRMVYGVDQGGEGLILGNDIEEGTVIRMTRGTRDELLAAARTACRQVAERAPRPAAAFVFDCISRKVVLGARYKEEIAGAFAGVAEGVPRVGFYTFGEVSPVDGVAMHHESTFTVAFLVVEG
jgi:hypothetical protein